MQIDLAQLIFNAILSAIPQVVGTFVNALAQLVNNPVGALSVLFVVGVAAVGWLAPARTRRRRRARSY